MGGEGVELGLLDEGEGEDLCSVKGKVRGG